MSGKLFVHNGGIRSGSWSKSKYTNLRSYDPWDLEVSAALTKIEQKLDNHEGILFQQLHTHPSFVSPLKLLDVKIMVGKLPAKFVESLEAIVLLGGTNKQLKSSNLTYGVYFSNKIFIHAFPKKRLEMIYSSIPKPSALNEYRRAGATLEKHQSGLRIRFDRDALKTFFERDVLLHEIGHHIDRANRDSKSYKKSEGFADWFATHYGYHERQ
jgi:hypothetical protein